MSRGLPVKVAYEIGALSVINELKAAANSIGK